MPWRSSLVSSLIGSIADLPRETEVGDDCLLALRTLHEHHVAALEVSVDHSCLVRGAEARRHLLHERQRLLRCETPASVQPFPEGLASQASMVRNQTR